MVPELFGNLVYHIVIATPRYGDNYNIKMATELRFRRALLRLFFFSLFHYAVFCDGSFEVRHVGTRVGRLFSL